MARACMKQRSLKIKKAIEKYKKKRLFLKNKLSDKNLTVEDRFIYQMMLNDLPRNSSRSRYRNRCVLTGRSRGYYRKFGLSRIALREYGLNKQVPGLVKDSWS